MTTATPTAPRKKERTIHNPAAAASNEPFSGDAAAPHNMTLRWSMPSSPDS
jgi:hypothetical protein